jgi:hypothetical protein
MAKHRFAQTIEQFPDLRKRTERRTPTHIARKHRIRDDASAEERIEITDPVLERHALRVGWELSERMGTRGGMPVKFVVARAIYRIVELDEEDDPEAVFELTTRKRVSGFHPTRNEPRRCEERRAWAVRHELCFVVDDGELCHGPF